VAASTAAVGAKADSSRSRLPAENAVAPNLERGLTERTERQPRERARAIEGVPGRSSTPAFQHRRWPSVPAKIASISSLSTSPRSIRRAVSAPTGTMRRHGRRGPGAGSQHIPSVGRNHIDSLSGLSLRGLVPLPAGRTFACRSLLPVRTHRRAPPTSSLVCRVRQRAQKLPAVEEVPHLGNCGAQVSPERRGARRLIQIKSPSEKSAQVRHSDFSNILPRSGGVSGP
jgi:hypothetical protein